jgi:hypothetical protein
VTKFSAFFRRTLASLPALLAALATTAATTFATAALTTPSDPSLPFNWQRPADETQALTDKTTYQMWDVFKSAAGPNAPDVFEINPNGVADAYDSASATSGGFTTGGGNIYSFSGVIEPRAIVPSFGLSGQVLNVLVQARVQGTEIDATDVTVNGQPLSSLANYSHEELERTSLGGQGFLVDHAWTFSLGADLASFTLDWGWGGPHASLDQIAVDTQVMPVPEPATLALLAVGGAGLGLVSLRHRKQRAAQPR